MIPDDYFVSKTIRLLKNTIYQAKYCAWGQLLSCVQDRSRVTVISRNIVLKIYQKSPAKLYLLLIESILELDVDAHRHSAVPVPDLWST